MAATASCGPLRALTDAFWVIEVAFEVDWDCVVAMAAREGPLFLFRAGSTGQSSQI
jgi:hypothetical protein